MASYEQQARRQMEQQAKDKQVCPKEDIDAAFAVKPPMKLKRAQRRLSRRRRAL